MRLALVAVLACAACAPLPTAPATAPSARAVYITDSFNGAGLFPIDAVTLADRSSQPLLVVSPLPSNSSVTASEDGTTVAVMNYTAASGADISLFDVRTGSLRVRFTPDVPVTVDSLSADGTRIFARGWPPQRITDERLVLDARGRVVSREPAVPVAEELVTFTTDVDGRRLYALVVPGEAKATGPRPIELAAWDLRSGSELWRLGLPSILGGEWITGRRIGGLEVRGRSVPGLALSPDRRRLAIATYGCCAPSGTLVLVDTSTGRLLSQRAVSAASLLERLFGSSVALAKSPEESTVVQASFGAEGVLHIYAQRSQVDDQGAPKHQYLGMIAVDVEDGRVLGSDVKMELWWYENRMFWTRMSPDGKWLYVFLERGGNPTPKFYALRRLDPRTLRVMAERQFDTYRHALVLLSD